jgi:molecular chaperone GrpE
MADPLTAGGISGKLPPAYADRIPESAFALRRHVEAAMTDPMSDEPPEESTDQEPPALVMPAPQEDAAPDVTYVVPAEPCAVVATDSARPGALEPAPAPGADLGPVLEAVAALGATLARRLDGLQSQFDREVRAEATREKVVDRLHAELQEYKQDLLLGVLRPVFVDLIQLHDDIGKMVSAHAEAGEEGAVLRLLEVMQGYQQAIEDILDRQGVVPYTQDGPSFDPRRQRAVATVATDDPTLARTIAARLRKGFRSLAGDRVIRAEIVSVYAFKHESS